METRVRESQFFSVWVFAWITNDEMREFRTEIWFENSVWNGHENEWRWELKQAWELRRWNGKKWEWKVHSYFPQTFDGSRCFSLVRHCRCSTCFMNSFSSWEFVLYGGTSGCFLAWGTCFPAALRRPETPLCVAYFQATTRSLSEFHVWRVDKQRRNIHHRPTALLRRFSDSGARYKTDDLLTYLHVLEPRIQKYICLFLFYGFDL